MFLNRRPEYENFNTSVPITIWMKVLVNSAGPYTLLCKVICYNFRFLVNCKINICMSLSISEPNFLYNLLFQQLRSTQIRVSFLLVILTETYQRFFFISSVKRRYGTYIKTRTSTFLYYCELKSVHRRS